MIRASRFIVHRLAACIRRIRDACIHVGRDYRRGRRVARAFGADGAAVAHATSYIL